MRLMQTRSAMADEGNDHLPRPRGVLASVGWTLAVLAASLVSAALLDLIWSAIRPTFIDDYLDESAAQKLLEAIGKSVGIGVIFIAAYRSRMGISDYLALVRPRGGHGIEIVIVALAGLALPLPFPFVPAPAPSFRFQC